MGRVTSDGRMGAMPPALVAPPRPAAQHDRDAREISDAELVDQCVAGDLGAMSALYDRHGSIAYSVAVRLTANPSDAEDVVQDAFLGLWRQAARFDPARASVRTWLLAIVHNRAIDVVRRRRIRVEPLESEGERTSEQAVALQSADPALDVLERLEAEDLWAAVARLSGVQREAIELAFGRGLTHPEVARATGVPLGTAKSRVRLGLLRLRQTVDAVP
jgi:RNA polymerase sigma-70 factor (ECF subfamily)